MKMLTLYLACNEVTSVATVTSYVSVVTKTLEVCETS